MADSITTYIVSWIVLLGILAGIGYGIYYAYEKGDLGSLTGLLSGSTLVGGACTVSTDCAGWVDGEAGTLACCNNYCQYQRPNYLGTAGVGYCPGPSGGGSNAPLPLGTPSVSGAPQTGITPTAQNVSPMCNVILNSATPPVNTNTGQSCSMTYSWTNPSMTGIYNSGLAENAFHYPRIVNEPCDTDVVCGAPNTCQKAPSSWTGSVGPGGICQPVLPLCPTGQYAGSDNNCYSCPTGYTRNANILPGPNACSLGTSAIAQCPTNFKAASNNICYSCQSGYTPNDNIATPTTNFCSLGSSIVATCPSGWTPRTDNLCYQCPSGYTMNSANLLVNPATACVLGSSVLSSCPSGSFSGSDGYCYSCPSGYTRNGLQDPAGNGSGCVPVVTGTDLCTNSCQFADPNGNVYTCPSGKVRSIYSVTDSQGRACGPLGSIVGPWSPATQVPNIPATKGSQLLVAANVGQALTMPGLPGPNLTTAGVLVSKVASGNIYHTNNPTILDRGHAPWGTHI